MSEDKVKLEIEVPRRQLRRVAALKTGSQKNRQEELKKGKPKTEITGYGPSKILKAPFESPEPSDKRPPNRHQQRVIFFGLAFVVLSPLLLFINLSAFIILALAGGCIVAFGSLVRV